MSEPSTSSDNLYKVPNEEEINQQLDFETKVKDLDGEVFLVDILI